MSGDDEKRTSHPAFGQIRVNYSSGRHNLFMVDYPQQHFVTLTISKADLMRSTAHDWVFAKNQLIEIEMSEVQWARLIASPNSEGVPCTLAGYFDYETKGYITPKMPKDHAANQDTFSAEIKAKAKDAAQGVKEALTLADTLMKGGPVKKSDLSKLQNLLYHANMQLAENLSFVVKSAEEAIDTAVEHGKAEIDAHIDFAMTRLGERALGNRLAEAIEKGVDVKQIGRSVADAVTDD